jgi:hypothetical protein
VRADIDVEVLADLGALDVDEALTSQRGPKPLDGDVDDVLRCGG